MDIGTVTNLPNPTKYTESIEHSRAVEKDYVTVILQGRAGYWKVFKYTFLVVGSTDRDNLMSTLDLTMPVTITLNGESYSGAVTKGTVKTKHDSPGFYEIVLTAESDRLS